MSSAIRYARNGDINIAYETVGSGPRDLVFIQGNITNLDIDWDDRRYREFCERRAEFSRLILFDKRGMGLSGRVETGTMEDHMNGGQGLVVIGVLYHDQLDPARAFAAQMQASALARWDEDREPLARARLREVAGRARAGRADAPRGVAGREAGRLAATDQSHPGGRHAALWKNEGETEEVSRSRGYFAVTKPTIASTRPSASAWLSSA